MDQAAENKEQIIAKGYGVALGEYHQEAPDNLPSKKRVLLVKPYQEVSYIVFGPPLGLLYLTSMMKQRFGEEVDVRCIDMKLDLAEPEELEDILRSYQPDIVGVSALNYEFEASDKISRLTHELCPGAITVLGGPIALRRGQEMLQSTTFDWVFSGPAERTFGEAISRHFNDIPLAGIPGFCYRRDNGELYVTGDQDYYQELDKIPHPAWELVDFDKYAKKTTHAILKGRSYAHIFTSRGCPYKCHYCHDIFTKRFTYRSVENVIEEIELLHETYGVTDFQIVDDIFNLHKPRLIAIMQEVSRRWPGKLFFSFPNGVRADILDEEVLDALEAAGTIQMSIAVETVTPRLQTLIDKNLDIEKTLWAINEADKRGIIVVGFFMLGFPTESKAELEASIRFALKSRLSIAQFFLVTPQPETPLYELAEKESPEALRQLEEAIENGDAGGYSSLSWYERAYGYPLDDRRRQAMLRFYFNPVRILKLLLRIPPKSYWISFMRFLQMMAPMNKQSLLGNLLFKRGDRDVSLGPPAAMVKPLEISAEPGRLEGTVPGRNWEQAS